MRTLAKVLSVSLIFSFFGERTYSQQRYFDYSGNDGCSPANIGHKLGGDLDSYADNTLEGMIGIASEQDSPCFKNWEFDLSEWQGQIFLSHAPVVSASQTDSLVSLAEFESAFQSIKAIKPIVIDLKHISSKPALEQVVAFARIIRSSQKPDIWFLVSPDNVDVLSRICLLASGEFDVMLYRRGGKYCGNP